MKGNQDPLRLVFTPEKKEGVVYETANPAVPGFPEGLVALSTTLHLQIDRDIAPATFN